jgi:heme-degrading monooxygenase HmoA
MPDVLLHVHFPYAGPWADAMNDALGAFADSLSGEPGLRWKLWLEHPATGRAGGSYLFADRASAEAYLARHRERLTQWGIEGIESSLLDVHDALSRRTGAAPALPPATAGTTPFSTWAEVAIEDFEPFLRVFSTAGREARRAHGSLRAQVFRVPGEDHAARVLIDWRDRACFEAFIDDPQVRETMRAGGARRPPVFTVVEAAGAFDA